MEVKDTKVMRELEGEGGHADGPKNIDEDGAKECGAGWSHVVKIAGCV